ncbi:hypothetical protein [Myroides odoratus]|uniref:hypothetical protein n=1 Tax=Myroides odoratus TaxID=256 RepID=UPI0039AF8EC2
MKKNYFLALMFFASTISWAQIVVPVSTDNRLPVYGKVGVGISAPKKSLHVKKPAVYEFGKEILDGDVWIDGGRLFIGNVDKDALGEFGEIKYKSDGSSMIESPYPFYRLVLNTPNFDRNVLDLAIAYNNLSFSDLAKKGDVVYRYIGKGSVIFGNENKNSTNNFKFTTKTINETYASTKLFIGNNGNVGIGTEIPDAKLAVNGDIHAKEVRIDLTGWPDYVFENTYVLPTIEEVEQHINEKGHLINIPSAYEVETSGLHVSEMIKKQQEKIEELTLYIIELNKQLQEVKATVNQKN